MPQRVIEGIEALRGLVGREVGCGDWFTVTQAHIDAFADVTQDRQWIHVDPDRAQRESPYGGTIAHGFLTLSLLSHLHSQAVQVHADVRMSVNYGLNRVRFTSGVRSGSRIRARSTLQEVGEVQGGVQLVWAVTVDVEGATKPALVAEWLVRMYL